MSAINRLTDYLIGARQELKKVVWPTKKEITNHTMLVIGISIALAIFIGVADYLLTLLLEIII